MPTNSERWQNYCSGLTSPQNYIDWSYRYIIAASLQRRVWLPPEHQPCFANMYIVPVGKAGLGKGLCVSKVTEFLRHWKQKNALLLNKETLTREEKVKISETHETNVERANEAEMQPKNKRNNYVEPLLIPVAANATTYEALVQSVDESFRWINYIDNSTETPKIKTYGHSSLCFSLPELASLLRKRTDDTVNYMLELYDCPIDYEYKTKTQGNDRVRRGCLNFFAATTPDFMQEIFNSKLINQGFGSRVMFICADKDRSTSFWIPEHTPDQIEDKRVLLEHIRQLTALYGKVQLATETVAFLESWWKEYAPTLVSVPKKLEGFASRMKVHVMKVAMAEHFGESVEMTIPTICFQKAITILEAEMKRMNFGLTMAGSNPISRISDTVLALLRRKGEMSFLDLHIDTHSDADKDQLDQAITFLLEAHQVEKVDKQNGTRDEIRLTYKIRHNNGD